MQDPNRRRRAVRFIIKSRSDREKFFSSTLFSEPAWDMLLKLYAAAVDQRAVSLLALARSANIRISTAARWAAALEKENLITRDRVKGAEVLSLSESGWLAMDSYFENMSSGEI